MFAEEAIFALNFKQCMHTLQEGFTKRYGHKKMCHMCKLSDIFAGQKKSTGT